jgi:hypothetical protein
MYDKWQYTISDLVRSLIMYGKWQYAIGDLFTITDNVQEMTICDQYIIYDHW